MLGVGVLERQMAFWKKKQQQRQHYRTVPPKKIAFGAYLEGVGGTHVHCQVADVSAGATDSAFVRPDGVDGPAVHSYSECCWFAGGLLLTVSVIQSAYWDAGCGHTALRWK